MTGTLILCYMDAKYNLNNMSTDNRSGQIIEIKEHKFFGWSTRRKSHI